MLKAISIVFL